MNDASSPEHSATTSALRPGMTGGASGTTPFVFLFIGRSGSTYLIEALQAHPRVLAVKETFAEIRNADGTAKEQLRWAREFLLTDDPAYRAVGFKTKMKDNLDPEGFADLLRELNARVVLLRRRNVIKQMVSVFNGLRIRERTGDWNIYQESERPSLLEIDVEKFHSWLEAKLAEIELLERYVGNLRLPTHALYYEDLLLDSQRSVEEIFSFLGIESYPAQGRCIKVTSDDLREAVANFKELRSSFAGTEFEAMFDEVLI